MHCATGLVSSHQQKLFGCILLLLLVSDLFLFLVLVLVPSPGLLVSSLGYTGGRVESRVLDLIPSLPELCVDGGNAVEENLILLQTQRDALTKKASTIMPTVDSAVQWPRWT